MHGSFVLVDSLHRISLRVVEQMKWDPSEIRMVRAVMVPGRQLGIEESIVRRRGTVGTEVEFRVRLSFGRKWV